MKISKAAAVSMCQAVSFDTADKWSDDRLTGKLNKLNELVDDTTKMNKDATDEDENNLEAILAALRKGEKIELDDDAPAAAPSKGRRGAAAAETEPAAEAEPPAAKPARRAAAKKPATKAANKPATRTAAKPVAAKAAAKTKPAAAPRAAAEPKEKKVGVIASCIEYLEAASEAKPITKEQILAKLAKRFPDKSVEKGTGMHITVTVQVPHRLRVDRDLKIKDNGEGGYWLPAGKR